MQPETRSEIESWTKPDGPEVAPRAGYDAWLADEIARGKTELDAGAGIPADDVWKDLGLE